MSNADITPELLLQAYACGMFPMAEDRQSDEIFWLEPELRGIIPLNKFHLSRSLARRIRKHEFTVSVDTAFERVVTACADRQETWINQTIFDLYRALHQLGHAHSLEVWKDDALTGGVYGVTLGGAFFGESMFSYETDSSKVALAYLVDHLDRCGFTLFDTQFLTDHLASLGGVEVPRATYMGLLDNALELKADFTSQPLSSDGSSLVSSIWQRSSHTS